MSVRRVKRRNRKTGAERQFWIVDVVFEHAGGRVERARKVSPVQTKRGAEEYERQLRAALLKPVVQKKEIPTLEAFAERWLESDAQASNRDSTVAEKRGQLRKHIVPQFGRLRLDAIGTERIAAFYAHLRRQKLALKTIKNIGGTLHRLLAASVEWEVLERLPRFPRLKVPESRWDYFSREEVAQLLRVVTDPFERALLVFAFDTGARSGEQIAITWGDIEWFNNTIVFRRASSRGVVGPTKDGEERRVPMTPRLAQALKGIRHLKGDLVFSQSDGKPLDPWRLRRLLDRACARAGLRRIRRHDCRHSFASQLVTAGVPLPQVQAWLGHSTIHMTMRYAHLAPNNGSELIRALDPSGLRQPDGNSGVVAS